MEKKETPQRNLRRFFVVGREPEKVTFRFAERNASFNFSGTFRFADYITMAKIHIKYIRNQRMIVILNTISMAIQTLTQTKDVKLTKMKIINW